MCEALAVLSSAILVLYAWTTAQTMSDQQLVFSISPLPAAIAGGMLLFTIVTYFIPQRHYTIFAVSAYGLLVATVVSLVITTGFTSSPFIALWMSIALIAPIFGLIGLGIVLTLTIAYLAYHVSTAAIDLPVLFTTGLLSVLPIFVGLLVWRHNSPILDDEHTNSDRSYHELANELSTISGQSEIVIAAITDGVIALNAKGELQLINPAAQRLIGWGQTDALGLDYRSVLKLFDNHDQAVNDTNDPIRRAITTNKEVTVDTFYLVTQDAKKRFLASITVSPVGSMGSGVIIVFRDITRERAQEREQAEFISTASHEMRTPVASIEGYLGLALNPATAQIDDKAREYIAKAQTSVRHLGRLFQDLLDVSRADDGRLTNKPEVIDVVAFTYDIIQGQLSQAIDKGLFVSYPPMPDLSPNADHQGPSGSRTLSPVYYINVDNTHFREVVGNLIENAIKYTFEGSVSIDVTADNESVTLSVKDSGVGIPKEDIGHLFQKFYRVDNTDTREIGGTGLGLYLSRKLVEVMGGRIWVESTYKKGSTFFVRFPRLDTVAAHRQIEASAENESAPPMSPSETVLPPSPPDPASTPIVSAPEQSTPAQSRPIIPPSIPNLHVPPRPASPFAPDSTRKH
jgi:PAS domain S-box-containing protein